MRDTKEYIILNAQASAASGLILSVEDFKTMVFALATDGGGTAALTVKFQGSVQEAAPNFGAVQSVANHWDYIECIDLQSGASVPGDTGVSVATADDYRLLEANVNGLKWVCATVTARTAGAVTVKGRLFSDN